MANSIKQQAARALLLVAHGSRRKASNQEVVDLSKRLSKCDSYFACEAVFLELAEPDISQGFSKLVEMGAKQIDVMPYFLAAGRHVVEDIPIEIKACQQSFPDVTIRLAPHLAAMQQEMAELVLTLMQQAETLDPV
jgi:sirohydrochlorin ferrochelatase